MQRVCTSLERMNPGEGRLLRNYMTDKTVCACKGGCGKSILQVIDKPACRHNIATCIWGSSFWRVAYKVVNYPSRLRTLMVLFVFLLPCSVCRENLAREIYQFNVDTYVKGPTPSLDDLRKKISARTGKAHSLTCRSSGADMFWHCITSQISYCVLSTNMRGSFFSHNPPMSAIDLLQIKILIMYLKETIM